MEAPELRLAVPSGAVGKLQTKRWSTGWQKDRLRGFDYPLARYAGSSGTRAGAKVMPVPQPPRVNGVRGGLVRGLVVYRLSERMGVRVRTVK